NSGYSNRSRSRSRQPVYTSDKKKISQENKDRYLRLLTVLGYVVFVSAPAVSLSIYYTCIWDPMYIEKHNESKLLSAPKIKVEIKPKRSLPDLEDNRILPVEEKKCVCESDKPVILGVPAKDLTLDALLKQHASEKDVSVSSESELLSSSVEQKSSESVEVQQPKAIPPAG
ncbi:hypothetical protein PFISCL1PPCAC_178, partial [Pristionchus fissidentatus]